ncbi:MAG: thiamine-phosphate kinase [Nitrosospira sp.]|nr:thiamine-phosphate kinase [Nitrosospira sp.]
MLSEFEIIQRYFVRPSPRTVLGAGDDAALIEASTGMELAVSTDMLVSGQHFFVDAEPRLLGHKSLAVNLSDMAAMGARPRWATLSLALPESVLCDGEKWLQAFAEGFFELAHAHQVDLIGGDTTKGPLNICMTIIGEVAKGKALRRSGARRGDDIWISGRLGDAALALANQQGHIVLEPAEIEASLPALLAPQPRVELGQRLIGLARSAIDVSDGLLADLEHILKRSKVGAIIRLQEINCPASIKKRLPQPLALKCLLAGGDDYELCFTAPTAKRAKIEWLSREQRIALTRIGTITEGEDLIVIDAAGRSIALEAKGYDHFRA